MLRRARFLSIPVLILAMTVPALTADKSTTFLDPADAGPDYGVVIHKDRVADHSTTASPMREGPEPGPIFLQNHGNPVRSRNIWVIEK